MLCHEKIQLLRAYVNATDQFNGAVEDLQRVAASKSYQRRLATAETARADCEQARLALAEHVLEHGC